MLEKLSYITLNLKRNKKPRNIKNEEVILQATQALFSL